MTVAKGLCKALDTTFQELVSSWFVEHTYLIQITVLVEAVC